MGRLPSGRAPPRADGWPVGADTPGPALKYETDKRVYGQGEVVKITVTNVSDVATPIVDRPIIDGGFAVLETKTDGGQWKAIELVARSDVHTFRALGPGEQFEYVWQTTREARGDAALPVGGDLSLVQIPRLIGPHVSSSKAGQLNDSLGRTRHGFRLLIHFRSPSEPSSTPPVTFLRSAATREVRG